MASESRYDTGSIKAPLIHQTNFESPGKSTKNTKPSTDIQSLTANINLPELEPLVNTALFIIQPKVDGNADFFHPNLTHEIFNEKKHLLFKGVFKRKLLAKSNQSQKIAVSNLRKLKILALDFEDNKLCASCNEAVISCPPGSPRGRVTKYGGKYEAPSYEITSFSSKKQILFSIEHNQSNSTSGSFSIDYSVLKDGQTVAQITSKSGLTFMLHIKESVSPLDKAVLLGFIIAMDVLKQGKTIRKTNEYEYN